MAGNPRRIRVLHLVHNIDHGGMERMIAEMARRTDRAVFDVHILALGYLGHFGPEAAAVATVGVARPMPAWSMLYPGTLAAEIREIAPDVVHAHSGVWYKAIRAAAMARVPARIYTDHGRQHPDPLLYRMIDRRASARTHRVVAVSEALATHMAGFVTDATRIRVIANGVDTERFAPDVAARDAVRNELGIAPEAPLIGSTGRFDPVKGYDVMIRAFARLLEDWRDGEAPTLLLVGDGPDGEMLRALARDCGVADRVRFLGWRADVERLVASLDLFTLASHSEGTSVSLLEAMSTGVCPAVTDVGGNATVLGPELRHRLVPAASPDALAAAYHTGLTDADSRRNDARVSRRRVVDSFSLDGAVRDYETLYREVLAAP